MAGLSTPPLRSLACLLTVLPGPVWASSGELSSLVHDIGFCVVLAGVLAIACIRVKIPEIAAFLVAGVIVGPVGAGLVTDPSNIETISELGLILLLYLIGLEIDFRKLLASGRILIITGFLQYPLSIPFGIEEIVSVSRATFAAVKSVATGAPVELDP